MRRRTFVKLLAAAASAKATAGLDVAAKRRSRAPFGQLRSGLPALRVVSSFAPAATPGMPGPYPGRVVAVASEK